MFVLVPIRVLEISEVIKDGLYFHISCDLTTFRLNNVCTAKYIIKDCLVLHNFNFPNFIEDNMHTIRYTDLREQFDEFFQMRPSLSLYNFFLSQWSILLPSQNLRYTLCNKFTLLPILP